MTTTYVNWGEAKVKLTWRPESHIPQYNLITSVHGFCFHNNKLLDEGLTREVNYSENNLSSLRRSGL